jgi:hypothetical protein
VMCFSKSKKTQPKFETFNHSVKLLAHVNNSRLVLESELCAIKLS